MDKVEIQKIVEDLRLLGREGGYWDFKKEWHKNKAELLIDIICMANNMENHDAYIIIGIDNAVRVVGVENDHNRKKLNQLSEFIAGKYFAVYTPIIDMQTIEIETHQIDVIIIRNTNKTPYYLEKDFSESGKIATQGKVYIRLNDRKAGVDSAAPYSCIEYLWKKRFGINLSIMQKWMLLLDDIDKWKFDWGNKTYGYHEDYPEFRMQLEGAFANGWWPCAAFYTHPVMHFCQLNLMYHNTVIYETEIWSFDQFGKFLPKATNFVPEEFPDFCYSFYDLTSIEGKLFTVFTKGTNDISSRFDNRNQLLIFNNMDDKADFDQYLSSNFGKYSDEKIQDEYQYCIREDNSQNGGGLVYSAFKVAKAAKLYSDWMSSKQ